MPLILNGSSLLKNTSGGLATTTACCCGQNPEECFCPDFCQYYAEITSPLFAAISGALAAFGECSLSLFGNSQTLFPQLCGPPDIVGIGTKVAGNSFAGFTALLSRRKSFEGDNWTCEGGLLYARADMFCGVLTDGKLTPRLGVVIQYGIQYNATLYEPFPYDTPPYGCGSDAKFGTPGTPIDFGSFSIDASGFFDLSSECKITSKKFFCADVPASRTAQFETPLSITLAHDLGNGAPWQVLSNIESGNQDLVQEAKDCLKSTTVTIVFRRRQSCRTVTCSCSQSLSGLLANFEGKQFTIYTSSTLSEFDGTYEYFWSYDGGLFFEFSKSGVPPSGGTPATLETKTVTLYCEPDDTVDPPVDRWYALFETTCFGYEDPGSQTTNAEVGYFPCYESAGCAGRTEGDPIPLGEAIEIEQVEGYPQTPDVLDECTPPARAAFELVENCG